MGVETDVQLVALRALGCERSRCMATGKVAS
jgi:hypothetical protein